MEPLEISATSTTPEVAFNAQTGHFVIRGISDEEDAFGFYFPLIQWIDTYLQHAPQKTSLDIQLKYFNTASTKALFEIIKRIGTLRKADKSTEINWFYDSDDPVLKEDIEQFCDLTDVPINVTSGAQFS
ncbi:MAG: DUF1987 domain-containing protein [Cyclobacteriaceae bacterium]